jgi:hypothetical protein
VYLLRAPVRLLQLRSYGVVRVNITNLCAARCPLINQINAVSVHVAIGSRALPTLLIASIVRARIAHGCDKAKSPADMYRCATRDRSALTCFMFGCAGSVLHQITTKNPLLRLHSCENPLLCLYSWLQA